MHWSDADGAFFDLGWTFQMPSAERAAAARSAAATGGQPPVDVAHFVTDVMVACGEANGDGQKQVAVPYNYMAGGQRGRDRQERQASCSPKSRSKWKHTSALRGPVSMRARSPSLGLHVLIVHGRQPFPDFGLTHLGRGALAHTLVSCGRWEGAGRQLTTPKASTFASASSHRAAHASRSHPLVAWRSILAT